MSLKKALTFLGWPILLLPTLVMLAGAFMNETVIWANGGQMPVSMYACQERFNAPKQSEDALFSVDENGKVTFKHTVHKSQAAKDYTHKCADATTKFRWLDDWMLGDDGVSSLGDMLQDESGALNYAIWPVWLAGVGLFFYKRKRYPEYLLY